MAEKQKLFWISKKTTYGTGKNALSYGDEVGDTIPEKLIPRFKKTGEIGSIEMASPENVETSAALEKELAEVKAELKLSNEKVLDYEVLSDEIATALQQDKLKKEEKVDLVEKLEALK